MEEKRRHIHRNIYLGALALMFISMPLSRFGMSLSQFILAGNWLAEGNIKKKWHSFIHNKAALVLSSLWLMHLAGLLYSTDIHYALEDLKKKLPILLLPLIFSGIPPLDRKSIYRLFYLYMGAVLTGVFIGFYHLFFRDIIDPRELSPFISHIRFGMHIVIVIYLFAFFFNRQSGAGIKILLALAILILLAYLLAIGSVSSLAILSFILILKLLTLAFAGDKRKSRFAVSAVILLLASISGFVYWAYYQYNTPTDTYEAGAQTALSNEYSFLNDSTVENGSHIYWYICQEELKKAWNRRSKFSYEGNDLKDQKLKYTLIRYLNSKGMRKDAAAVEKLSEKDIRNIEKGIANVVYTRYFDPRSRLYKLFWEYNILRTQKDPSGHSFIQRLVFWKHGINIIKEHPFFGVGTGDIPAAYQKEYSLHEHKLKKEFQFRAHQQYLTIFIGFGIAGFLWFLISLIYPAIYMHRWHSFLYIVFFITMSVSMLFEDTLETQAGATMFAFLNAFLLFLYSPEEKK